MSDGDLNKENISFKVLVNGVEKILPFDKLEPFLKGLDGKDGKDGVDGKDCIKEPLPYVGGIPTPPKNKPWPSLKKIDGELTGNFTRTRSLLFPSDGKSMIGMPYHGHDGKGNGIGLNVDLEKQYASGYVFDERKGYIGSCLHSSGKQVAFPAYAMGYAVLNEDDTFEHVDWPWKLQIRSGAEAANGKIYSASFTSNPSIVSLDLTTNKIGYSNDKYVYDEETAPKLRHHWGAVEGKGRVYLLPWYNDKIGMINMSNDGAFELSGSVTGGHTDKHAIAKFSHGVFHETSGLVVSMPRRADTILLIDPDTDTHEEFPLPKGLIDLLGGEFVSKSFGCVIGPDDLVYSCPWTTPIMFRFDPVTKKIEWKDFTEEFAETGWIRNGTGITTDARLIGNEIYFGSGAGQAVKLVF